MIKREPTPEVDFNQMRQDFRSVFMDSDAGLRVFRNLLVELGFYSSTFASGDPEQTMINEGRRQAAIYITEQCQHLLDDPQELLDTAAQEGRDYTGE